MKHVTFEEYEAAKAEILLGVQYKEDSTLAGNVIRKTYAYPSRKRALQFSEVQSTAQR